LLARTPLIAVPIKATLAIAPVLSLLPPFARIRLLAPLCGALAGFSVQIVAVFAVVVGLIGLPEAILCGRRRHGGLHRAQDAEIMLRVLQIAFRHHPIARGTGVARQLQIFFIDRGGVAAHFNVRPIAFKATVGLVVSAGLTTPAALTLHRRFTD
jgi:hypothetical protein